MVANSLRPFILRNVKITCWFRPAALCAIIFIGAGCSGINTSHSFSPLSFFLPGIVKAEPKLEKTDLTEILPIEVAKDLAQAN